MLFEKKLNEDEVRGVEDSPESTLSSNDEFHVNSLSIFGFICTSWLFVQFSLNDGFLLVCSSEIVLSIDSRTILSKSNSLKMMKTVFQGS